MSGDLHRAFPGLPITEDYCTSAGYRDWERQVAKPYMEERGYSEVSFYMVEQDSFGPLIRGVIAHKDGKKHEWFYG